MISRKEHRGGRILPRAPRQGAARSAGSPRGVPATAGAAAPSPGLLPAATLLASAKRSLSFSAQQARGRRDLYISFSWWPLHPVPSTVAASGGRNRAVWTEAEGPMVRKEGGTDLQRSGGSQRVKVPRLPGGPRPLGRAD